MIKDRIKQAKKLSTKVNLCREVVKYNGAYNPKRYKDIADRYNANNPKTLLWIEL